ncbi:choice-of-anchor H family protein [Shewanella sp. Isolate11]|uniref:choice-of-anchor H family protein n=1 Tax=Shewanella sp. Isolate11 TaxID=2908530 RepID=UPI001EFE00FF|nr:choice-of-anchor H family protein [Shewanella sp. Isolate11]MCG9696114.1 choice-of-anchor H family protein [Shewanella sp. Isolate11]
MNRLLKSNTQTETQPVNRLSPSGCFWSKVLLTTFALLFVGQTFAESPQLERQANDSESITALTVASITVVSSPVEDSRRFSRAASEMNSAELKASLQLKQMLNGDLSQVQQNPLVGKTREQVIVERTDTSNTSKILRSAADRLNAGIYHQFYIYQATSRLFEDIDRDGFYQTFSVTFDADVQGYYTGEYAEVYADLYLSRNGGPWELYHTTDIFTIVDDASDDDFEVLTSLHRGYYSDHYDVLIDLYEVGYNDIVATISSDDVDDLYALPLESADRDDYYVETEVIVSGSSVTLGSILALLLLLAVRRSAV